MPSDSRSSLLIVVLGILSLVFPALASSRDDGPTEGAHVAGGVAPSAAPSSSGDDWCEREMLRPIEQHFALPSRRAEPAPSAPVAPVASIEHAVGAPSAAPSNVAAVASAIEAVPHTSLLPELRLPHAVKQRLGESDVTFLIATVPDPIDSGLAYEFDRDLEALQLAIEHDARLRDRSWLPWNPLAASAPSDADATRACRRQVPGIILFRQTSSASAPERLLVLLLVGETPTWGVHKPALHRALDLVATLSKSNEARIVGPAFSGSSDSIRRLVDEYSAERADTSHVTSFKFVSGTASSRRNRATLDNDGGSPALSFRATTAPDDELMCAFYGYLARLGVGRDTSGDGAARLRRVALLHESGTEYGSGFGPAAQGGVACDRPEAELGFPPHISYLRSAYETEERKNAARVENGAPPVAVTRLDPSLEESAPPLDVEPTLSNKTTFSHDVVLSNLLVDIARRDVHYLGIVATDPADIIFLARQIRRTVPDIRLFTFGSEVLYLHPSYAADLDGMFVVSSYPFFGASEFRRPPADARGTLLTFSGQGPEGVYNAARALLADGVTSLVEYPPLGAPVASVLPTWISVVSRGRLVPLEAMPLATSDYVFAATPAKPSDPAPRAAGWGSSPPKIWILGVFLSSIFVWANLFALATRFLKRRNLFAHGSAAVSRVARFFERFEPCVSDEEHLRQSYYVFVTMLALTLTHFTMLCGSTPGLVADSAAATCTFVLGIVSAVAALVGAVAAFVVVFATRTSFARAEDVDDARNRVARSTTLAVVIAAAMGVAITVGLVSLSALGGTRAQVGVFAERATNLVGGASPLAPLAIVGASIYVWGLCQLTRIRLLDTLHARWVPGTGGIVPSFRAGVTDGFRADFRRLVDDVISALGSLRDGGIGYFAAVGTLVGTAFLIFALKPPLIFEGVGARALMEGAFALVVLVTGSGIVRLLTFSVRLLALLRRIGRHPIAEAFARLPAPFARSVESFVSAPSSDVADLVVPVRQADTLASTVDAMTNGGRDGARLDAALDEPLARFVASVHGEPAANGRAETIPLRTELRRELSAAANGEGRVDLSDSPTMGRLTISTTCLWDVVDAFWQNRVTHAKTQSPTTIAAGSTSALDAYADTLSEPARAWMRLAEELVATHLTFTIGQLLRHFRHFTTMVTVGAFTLLLFVSSYAMQPKRVLLTFVWVVMLSSVGTGMYVYFKLERDEVLSRISKTDPGKITFSAELVTRVLTWGVLPILGVVAAQYPDLGRTAFGWLAPVTKLMH